MTKKNSSKKSFVERNLFHFLELLNIIAVIPAMVVVMYAFNMNPYLIAVVIAFYLVPISIFFDSSRTKKIKNSKQKFNLWDFLIVVLPDIASLLLATFFVLTIGFNPQTLLLTAVVVCFGVINGYKKWNYLRASL